MRIVCRMRDDDLGLDLMKNFVGPVVISDIHRAKHRVEADYASTRERFFLSRRRMAIDRDYDATP